jgi:septal ring factor EnvC (AmiA/AmiB activator)
LFRILLNQNIYCPFDLEKMANSNAEKGSKSSLSVATRGRPRNDVSSANRTVSPGDTESALATAEEKLRLQTKEVQKLQKELVAQEKKHKNDIERQQHKLTKSEQNLSSARAALEEANDKLEKDLPPPVEVKHDSKSDELIAKLADTVLTQR